MTVPDPNAFSLDINDPQDAELIEYFLGELPERIDAIMVAFTNDDLQGLGRLAHQLKGAAPGFGFPQIGAQASKLEEQIRNTCDPAESVDSLRSHVESLISMCKSYIDHSQPR